MMKFLWTFTLLCISILVNATAPGDSHLTNYSAAFENAEFAIVKNRMLSMESIVEVNFDAEVESYVRGYLTYGRRDAERLLAFAEIYFPIIEYQLNLFNLPEELKYLPVIESSLTPYAVSTAGAAGLWQLRKGLGNRYGLEINNYLDERRDPYKSTQVALQYLSKMHDRFGSWELALAAYNCGPTKVSQAIREAGSRDFQRLKNFLPRETARFIPRFIAASYFMKFHELHGLSPSDRYAELKDSRPVSVYHRITFEEISKVTGISISTIRKLNPVFFRNIVPENHHGNYVSLPKNAALKLSQHLNLRCNYLQENSVLDTRMVSRPLISAGNETYTVKKGDSLSKISRQFGCSVNQLKAWNGISGTTIYIDQTLKVGVVRA